MKIACPDTAYVPRILTTWWSVKDSPIRGWGVSIWVIPNAFANWQFGDDYLTGLGSRAASGHLSN